MSDEDKFQPRPRALPAGAAERPPRNRSWLLGAAVLLAVLGWFLPFNSPYPLALAPGIAYTNYHLAEGPWSIHVVRVERAAGPYEIHSVHARGTALGLGTLSAQAALVRAPLGIPVAGINGDFYQRNQAYAGRPRGLQIADGAVLSAPNGGAAFWLDAAGQPHVTNVVSRFQVVWPDGTTHPCGFNEELEANALVLYTPALGPSTRTRDGVELILEREGPSPWLPVRMEETYAARVREVRRGGNSRLAPGTMILSLGSDLAGRLPSVECGAVLRLATASEPPLRDARDAMGGGPALLREGKKLGVLPASSHSYPFTSMRERHPRAAVGWNARAFFFVEVDGRQDDLSVGMSLEELSAFLRQLGCAEAMNLDGGGSATLWFNGRVRNNPCDGYERAIANSLIVVMKSIGRPPGDPRPDPASN